METSNTRRATPPRCLLALSLWALVACVEVGRAPGSTSEKALEIEAYADRAKSLEPSRQHLLESWAKLVDAPTYEGFRSTLRSRVLPAVEAYLTALEGCEAHHPEISKVHGALVEAYGLFVRGLRSLSSKAATLPATEIEEALRTLLLDARQAQEVYRQDMSTLYAQNGYQLVVDEKLPEKEPGTKEPGTKKD